MTPFESTLEYARKRDGQDALQKFRDEFHIPRNADGSPKAYLVGNSLGLQPKQTAAFVQRELQQWQELGVEGHFEGDFPWMPYHEFLTEPMARIVGALRNEVVVMNSLTANLHLMLATFYQPEGSRNKILIEKGAFPSDHFAVESHLAHRGVDPSQGMLFVGEGDGAILHADDVAETIRENRDQLALVMLPGVQYYTGQFLDLESITTAAHEFNVPVGFDLAHAVGNVPLSLHDWNVDFAVWCTYKYLNSGPGSLGGCYIHERHASNSTMPRLAGWWGQNKATRFDMRNHFDAIPTAEGWQLSNPAILSMAAIRSSLDVFDRAGGMQPLREKSLALTGYFEWLLNDALGEQVNIATPSDPQQRGCQLSLVLPRVDDGRKISMQLAKQGSVTDWREPNVIRCAAVPLYNSFEDVFRFVETLKNCL